MPFAESIDGTKLYYNAWGEGQPVVLVHGWPLSSDTWHDLAINLVQAGFRVVMYDRRGFGRSDQPYSSHSYNVLTDDLHCVMDTLQLKDAVLVGFSMGGGEVIRYPQRYAHIPISKLILISAVTPLLSSCPGWDGVAPSVFEQMKAEIEIDRAGFFTKFFQEFHNVRILTHPVSNSHLDWCSRIAMQASLKSTLDCIDSFAFTDFRRDLVKTKQPVLFIHGTEDKIVPLQLSASRAVELTHFGQLICYGGGSHGLLATHKKELTRDIVNFLQIDAPVQGAVSPLHA